LETVSALPDKAANYPTIPPIMKSTEIFTVIFNLPVQPGQVQAFRKAMTHLVSKWRTKLTKAKIATDLFHNHDEKTGKNLNRYPLVQFKQLGRRGAMTGIGKGADAVKEFSRLAANEEPEIVLNGQRCRLSIHKTEVQQEHDFKTNRKMIKYRMRKWLPMDDEFFRKWEKTGKLSKRVDILDECLHRQVSRFITDVCKKEIKDLKTHLTDISNTGWTEEYHFRKMYFDVIFECNVSLPHEVGIGQVPSIGFGRISRIE
jgi:hypothetical protein